MSLSLLVLALLGSQAHALAVLISSPSSAAVGSSFTIHVTFSSCAASLDQAELGNAFQFNGASASFAGCAAVTTQSSICTFNLLSSESDEFEVALPPEVISSSSPSNTLEIEVAQPPTFSVDAPYSDDSSGTFLLKAESDIVVGVASPTVTVTKAGTGDQVGVTSVTVTSEGITVEFDGEGSTTYEIAVPQSAVLDATSGVGNNAYSIDVLFRGDSKDCIQSSWSSWSVCNSDACAVGKAGTFLLGYPTQSRTRTTLVDAGEGGTPCGALTEERNCDSVERCVTAAEDSRPNMVESLDMCPQNTDAGFKCSPKNTESKNPRWEFVGSNEVCSCDESCIEEGTCCQAFFINDCCSNGNCVEAYKEPANNPGGLALVYPSQYEFPLSCPLANCLEGIVNFQAVSPATSYYCFCDAQCVVDKNCCGGEDFRLQSCIAADAAGR